MAFWQGVVLDWGRIGDTTLVHTSDFKTGSLRLLCQRLGVVQCQDWLAQNKYTVIGNFIREFYRSVAACKIVKADLELIYILCSLTER